MSYIHPKKRLTINLTESLDTPELTAEQHLLIAMIESAIREYAHTQELSIIPHTNKKTYSRKEYTKIYELTKDWFFSKETYDWSFLWALQCLTDNWEAVAKQIIEALPKEENIKK